VHSRIGDIVAAINPFDEQERREITQVADWIESGKSLYRGSGCDHHLIAYFLPLDFEHRSVLLGHHNRSGLWLPGGGHLEPGEDPLSAMLREMKEEIGEQWPALLPLPYFLSICPEVGEAEVHTDIALWYLVRGDGHTIPSFDPREFSQMRWYSWDRLPIGRTDDNLARCMEKVEQWW